VHCRTSCKEPDVHALFRRPTEPQPAAFILPSRSRVRCCPWPHRRICDNARNPTKKRQATHYGLHSAQTDLSIGASLVTGPQLPLSKCSSCAARLPFCSSADVPFGFLDLAGTNALDQPHVRSSGRDTGVLRTACGLRIGRSDAMSLASKYASFGRSKFGALPSSAVARTASAKPESGRSREPRKAAIAQQVGSGFDVVLQRSTSWVSCRAPNVTFGHGARLPTRLLPDQGMHQLRFYVECPCGYQRHEVHGRSPGSRLSRHRSDTNAEVLLVIGNSVYGPVRPPARFRSHSESVFPTAAVHSACRESAREEAGPVVIKQADRGQFACEEHDHGLSNVHKGWLDQ
jgi:hypothetical protein